MAIYCLLAEDWSLYLRALGFIVLMPVALVYLKSLLPRQLPIPPAIILVKPEDEPTPYAFLARVAADVGAPPPRRLWIGSGTELRMRGGRSLVNLLWFGRYDIEVGLWLWHMLTLSEFQALLTRTVAPLSRGRREQFRLAARAILEALVDGQDFIDEMAQTDLPLSALARLARGTHSTAVWPLRFVGRALLRTRTNDADALIDDLAAVRITGSDALVHAVMRADFACAALKQLDDNLMRAAHRGVFSRDLYAQIPDAVTLVREAHNDFTLGEAPVLRGPHAGKYADVFEPGQTYLSQMWDHLPSPLDREQNAKRQFIACERDDRPASELIDESQRLREQLTALHCQVRFDLEDDYLPLDPPVMTLWIKTADKPVFPTRCGDIYEGQRLIDPGTPQERESALLADGWTDARLVRMAGNLFEQAGERATRWRSARTALDKVLRRTIFRPSGRDRAIVEDLEDDLRKLGRWLSAFDRWVYVVHVHMAARLPDLALHDALLKRYESVLRFGALAVDALEYRNRVAAFLRLLRERDGLAPYRLQRDANREFKASRKDLDFLLKEAANISDPLLSESTGEISLDRFLYSHASRRYQRRLPVPLLGERLLRAWDELTRKAHWLHFRNLGALLELQEQIADQFRSQVGPLPAEEEAMPAAIVLEQPEESPEIDTQPEVIDLEPEEGPKQTEEATQEDLWWD